MSEEIIEETKPKKSKVVQSIIEVPVENIIEEPVEIIVEEIKTEYKKVVPTIRRKPFNGTIINNNNPNII